MDNLRFRIRACEVVLLVIMAAVLLPAQTFTTLHSFNGTDGQDPIAPLVQASNGILYGTTLAGGTSNDGTLFEITTSGALTTLHSFDLSSRSNGIQPRGGLLEAADGNLYGTTLHGGNGGVGTVFKIALAGSTKTVASLNYPVDGALPQAGLAQGRNGIFFGTASNGGNFGAGAVYELSSFGQLGPLYIFGSNQADGFTPMAPVIVASDGNLYGTAFGGGVPDGCGTIFKLTPTGTFTLLHSFLATDGCQPAAALVQGTDGNLCGTASTGGASGFNAGTFFKISLSGTFTLLHVFDVTDGAAPTGGLIQASDGNFYGTTQAGGAHGKGTIFKVTPNGTVTTLYSFCSLDSCNDGSVPYAELIQGSDGNFYGTTTMGGAHNDGTVFSLSAGLTR